MSSSFDYRIHERIRQDSAARVDRAENNREKVVKRGVTVFRPNLPMAKRATQAFLFQTLLLPFRSGCDAASQPDADGVSLVRHFQSSGPFVAINSDKSLLCWEIESILPSSSPEARFAARER